MSNPINFLIILAVLSGLYATTLRAQTLHWPSMEVVLTLAE